jgi:hypothetical protein
MTEAGYQNYVAATAEDVSDDAEFNEFVPYKNSTFGVYADYPENWDVVAPVNEPGHRVFNVVQFWSPDLTSFVSVGRDIFNEEESESSYLAEIIQSYGNSFNNFSLITSDNIETMLADNPGYMLLYSYNEDDTGVMYLTLEKGTIIPGTDMAYFVEYNAPIQDYANNEEDALSIIDSLEFHILLPKTETVQPPESDLGIVQGEDIGGI